MRIAVAGGTGLVGRHVVEALGRGGHEPVVLARSHGVDVMTGEGLDQALAGVEAVIDVTNFYIWDAGKAQEAFATAADRLLAAEHAAGVGHHVVLSIVGLDRVEGNAHYAGKRAQEQHALAGPVPVTVLRATQFHDFAEMVAEWTREGSVTTVPPLLVQPIAVSDVSAALVDTAIAPPQTRATDVAGPEPQDLVDMASARCRRGAGTGRSCRAGEAGPWVWRWRGKCSCQGLMRGGRVRPSTSGWRRSARRWRSELRRGPMNLPHLFGEVRGAGPDPDVPLIFVSAMGSDTFAEKLVPPEARKSAAESSQAKHRLCNRPGRGAPQAEVRRLDDPGHSGIAWLRPDPVVQAIRDTLSR